MTQTEQTYFFRLSAYTDKLLALTPTDFIAPETRRNEVISFVSGGGRPVDLAHLV